MTNGETRWNDYNTFTNPGNVEFLNAEIGNTVQHLFTQYDIDWIEWRENPALDAQGIATLRSRKDGSTLRIGANQLTTWLWGI